MKLSPKFVVWALLIAIQCACISQQEQISFTASGTYTSGTVISDLNSAYDQLSPSVEINLELLPGQDSNAALYNYTYDLITSETFMNDTDILVRLFFKDLLFKLLIFDAKSHFSSS